MAALSVTRLLQELIALPSVNPAFLPEGHPRAGEQRMADFLSATAAHHGLEIELRPVIGTRANLLARLSPPGEIRSRVILAPHLDTVNAEDQGFAPVVKGTRIYGRGACDTKGAVAAMMTALCDLSRSGMRPAHTEIVFLGLVDEEHAQAGSRAFAHDPLEADLAIVGEPTRARVVTAHKGSVWLLVRTRGKAAHGSQPQYGDNAVTSMARVVTELQNGYAPGLAKRKHPLLGNPTWSLGTICGGTQANIVPDSCEIIADRRTLPGETETGVVREVSAFLRQRRLKADVRSCKLSECLPLETNPKLPMVARLLRAARQAEPLGAQYFCDAAVLAQGGISSVVFGPGDIAQAHTTHEWVSVSSLERTTAILTRFLRELP